MRSYYRSLSSVLNHFKLTNMAMTSHWSCELVWCSHSIPYRSTEFQLRLHENFVYLPLTFHRTEFQISLHKPNCYIGSCSNTIHVNALFHIMCDDKANVSTRWCCSQCSPYAKLQMIASSWHWYYLVFIRMEIHLTSILSAFKFRKALMYT